MSLSPELTALRDEALQTNVGQWAGMQQWKLSPANAVDRAGPCPVCGGHEKRNADRFSINTLKDAFNCRQCGIRGFGVINLVMQTQNITFVPACEIITGRKASQPIDPARAAKLSADAKAKAEQQAKAQETYRRFAREAGYRIWCEAGVVLDTDLDGLVAQYLALRGLDLSLLPPCVWEGSGRLRLREHPALEYFHPINGRSELMHTIPAMVAAVQYANGKFAGAHQTWIDLSQPKGKAVLGAIDGKMLPVKKMRGTKTGGAIRLYTPPNPRRIVMGEGIETTLTPLVYAMDDDTAYWAGVTLGNMSGKGWRDDSNKIIQDQPDMDDGECFVPPEWCTELVYLAEGDEGNLNDKKLIRGLRRAKRLRPDIKITLVPAPGDGMDMNDVAMAMNKSVGVA